MNIIEIYEKFPVQLDCITFLEKIKWNNVPKCPYCNSTNATPRKGKTGYNINRYHCNSCNTDFTVLIGTIFQNTKLPLQKWFLAICLILNAKKGISSRQLARDIHVTKDTAWYIQMRIREAMKQNVELLNGIVEMDETYVGGKPRKSKKDDDDHNKRGRGTSKTPVVGMVERNGEVRAKVHNDKSLSFKELRKIVKEHIDIDKTKLITDEYRGYTPFSRIIDHETINHQYEYVRQHVHTNTIEGFWSLLKRGIIGQYHKVSIKYLNRYVDEFCYKYNNRNNKHDFGSFLGLAVGG